MPSRKRSQGKARKSSTFSKKDNNLYQQKENHQKLIDRIRELDLAEDDCRQSSNCEHGALQPAPNSKITPDFIQIYEQALNYVTNVTVKAMQSTHPHPFGLSAGVFAYLDTHGVVTKTYRIADEDKTFISSQLVSLGTQYLLKNDPHYITKATTTALAVVALESTGTFDALRSGMNLGIARDLVADQQRESVRFFAKRNNCNCLKNMHQYLKAKPKYGVCASCATSKERKKLLMCDGCKVAQVRDTYAVVAFRFHMHIGYINVAYPPLYFSVLQFTGSATPITGVGFFYLSTNNIILAVIPRSR